MFLGFAPAAAAERVEGGTRFAGSDVFADQMRFAYRHVELGRRLIVVRRGILDDQTFLEQLAGWCGFFQRLASLGYRQRLQTKITADAMFEVDDVISFRQIHE